MQQHIFRAFAVVLSILLVGCATCVPYAPDEGLFINSGVTFDPVTSTATTVGVFSIALNASNQVIVRTGTGSSITTVAQVDVPPGMVAYHLFYGTGNRFLLLDLHTAPPIPPAGTRDFKQVVVDLLSGQTQGHALTQIQYGAGQNPQLNIYPSPGNGLAFLVWYGLGSSHIENAAIYRSDSGAQMCSAGSFTATGVQIIAKVTPATVQILDGGTVKQECAVPAGMLEVTPLTQSFGTIPSNTTATRSFNFRNTGTDCCVVSNIAASAHFQLASIPSSNTLNAGQSQTVTIQFNPNGDVGTFNETLNISRYPARGTDSIQVSGTSISSMPQLTVKKILRPASDSGRFNLQIDGVNVASALGVGNGGSTGPQSVAAGAHTVSETAAAGTSLAGYTTTIGGDCAPNGATTLVAGDNKTCTITNVGMPRLTVRKIVRPASDTGKFNLQIDAATLASNVGDGGSTGAQVVSPGTHTVSETAATGTNLFNYATAIGGDCTSTGSVTLAMGDNKICTITNTASVDDATVTVTSFPGSLPTGATGQACVNARNTGTTTWVPQSYILKLWQSRSVSLPINYVDLSGPVAPSQTVSLCFDVKCNHVGTGTFAAVVSGMRAGQFGSSDGRTIICQ